MVSDGFIHNTIRKQQQRIVSKLQHFSRTRFPRLTLLVIAVPVLFILVLICRDRWLNPFTGAGLEDDSSEVTGEIKRVCEKQLTDDKLLGGLLAGNFTRDCCLSRYQSMSYRKPSPHQPSSYLISKLREYEELHKRCGPDSKSYKKTITELVSGQIDGSSECKYVVWVAKAGLGNRILSITSTFLYALLTNRVLLINEEPNMENLFCEPFPYSSWLLPKDFPLKNRLQHLQQNSGQSFGNLLKTNKINASTELLPPYLYIHLLSSDYDLHDKLFFCDQDQAVLRNVTWLTLKSDLYFLPSLFLMSSFGEELCQLFPDKETVFHHLGRYLFHPSNQVWKLITSYYNKYLTEAEERIGIQIRVFDRTNSPFQHFLDLLFDSKTITYQLVMDQILTCTGKGKLLPQLDMGKSIDAAHPSKKGKSTAVLITSLVPYFYERMKNMYLKHPTLNGEVVAVYQPSHEEKQRSKSNVHNQKAWAEINLLSMMDVLVTSGWSTFGYVAQGMGSMKPWILYKMENPKLPDPVCIRAMSMEPCFHGPPVYDCMAKRDVDTANVVPYLRRCEDMYWGIKLFNTT